MNLLAQALYAKLTGSSTLVAKLATATSIFEALAPQGSAFPYLVFSLQDGRVEGLDPNRREDIVYQVQAITSSGLKDACALDELVDALLHEQPLSIAGYTVLIQRRDTRIEYVETVEQASYYHVGGLYRFWITTG